jgi:hypothetical protein
MVIVEPPPSKDMHQTLVQVQNFVLDHEVEVMNFLPLFFGVGAFQFRNPLLFDGLYLVMIHGLLLMVLLLRFTKHDERVR